jgi:hypothetical protein
MKFLICVLVLVGLCFSQELLDKNYFNVLDSNAQIDNKFFITFKFDLKNKNEYTNKIEELNLNDVDKYILMCICGLIDVDDVLWILKSKQHFKDVKKINNRNWFNRRKH